MSKVYFKHKSMCQHGMKVFVGDKAIKVKFEGGMDLREDGGRTFGTAVVDNPGVIEAMRNRADYGVAFEELGLKEDVVKEVKKVVVSTAEQRDEETVADISSFLREEHGAKASEVNTKDKIAAFLKEKELNYAFPNVFG